mgnify:CR=1 FL=1
METNEDNIIQINYYAEAKWAKDKSKTVPFRPCLHDIALKAYKIYSQNGQE